MSKHKLIIAYEFSTLYIEGQAHKDGEIPIGKVSFDNLWDFILSNKASEDADAVMSVQKRGGRQIIRTGRYVGTIQTKDGQIIEVLPKIYKASGRQEEDKETCRKVFLNMLRHFSDSKARSFQKAALNTKKGFPILEVYINNYINAVEELVIGGLKKNYALVSENQTFLKGRLDISKQITKNVANKARFTIRYEKFIEDIPQNRVIVSTLIKLMDDSHSTTNKAHIANLLMLMSNIPPSTNIEKDIKIASSGNRLFSSYELLITWSKQFLLNRGFTTFSGAHVNQSLLFKAEKLFEDFIAYLFKKYARSYNVATQNTRYFLVNNHTGKRMFQLRPDIVVETDRISSNYECIIIDTKWKAIDSGKPDRNYLIDIKDMYQLYAYGQKYLIGQSHEIGIDVIPKLVLVYPYSEKFTECLPEFNYDDIKENIGLRLMVVPFDLSDPSSYEKQIHNIIHCLDVKPEVQPIYKFEYDIESNSLPLVADGNTPHYGQTTLVGCYRSIAHLEWIKKNHLYNIRIGDRSGGASKSGLIVSATKLILYNANNPKEYQVFSLNPSNQILADYDLMKSKDYPELKKHREYLLYVIDKELEFHSLYDVESLKNTFAPKLRKGAPFFVTSYNERATEE